MLSINPISFNQKNRQSTPSFKGRHTLTLTDSKVVGDAHKALGEVIKIFRTKLKGSLSYEQNTANTVLVNCADSDDKVVSSIVKMLAEIY